MTHAHHGTPVVAEGAALDAARGAVVMIHGRGAGPDNILELVPVIGRPSFAYLAPAAANRTWYPSSFMRPFAENEPFLGAALTRIGEVLSDLAARGVPAERVVLLGFSQGACLAGEYAVRHPQRYGGVVMLSGGLIGPPGTTWPTTGRLLETPVFLGCSDRDAHIPKDRVDESAAVFEQMGAEVTERIYPNMGHLVTSDEIVFVRAMLDHL